MTSNADRPASTGKPSRSDSGDADATVHVSVPDGPIAAVPTRLGRYVVVEEVGAGGMGRVLRAYDPKLRREVALKVLRTTTRESQGAARIIREAQAMARLSHPNLVPIYDVEHGDVERGDGELFLAMEFVEGTTLKAWLGAARRRWPEVVRMFVEAGRGLAAAHAAGIVHRDFKPANAMVGADGRVRVMDFGLARGLGPDPDPSAAESLVRRDDFGDLTEAGSVIGTPSFMAPEQHTGGAVGAASDQYAFCVALYDALYGVRPFDGKDLPALVRAKLQGTPQTPNEAAPRVPRWLHAAVVRGLAVDPGARWPTMDALLAALARGQSRARTRRIVVAIAGLGAAVAVVALLQRVDERRRTAACEAAGASIAEIWHDGTRARVREALLSTGVSYATTTAEHAMPWLDTHARAWQQARTEACLDADVRGRWDAELLDRSLWCLDERRMELQALVDALAGAEPDAVLGAVAAAAGLGGVEICRDAAALPAPPPTERREPIREVRVQLAQAGALARTGALAQGAALASAARAHAETLQWPPLVVAALVREADLQRRQGEFAAAEQTGVQAYFQAAAAGAWDLAAAAATDLVIVTGHLLARPADGLVWARHAEVAAGHATDPEGLRASNRLANVAMVLLHKGDLPQARAQQEQSLALLEQALGPEHPDVAALLLGLGNVHYATGEFAQTVALDERALVIFEQTFGPDHPDVARALNNLGNATDAMGDPQRARTIHQRALTIREAALGADHPDVAQSLLNLANAHYDSGDPATARPLMERAVAILEAELGPDHPFVATGVENLATMYSAAGDDARARVLYERTLATRERTLGRDHPEVARALVNMAAVHGDESDHATAVALGERAVAIYDLHEGVQDNEPTARYSLARLIVSAGGDHERARRLVEQARAGYVATGPGHEDDIAEMDAWVASIATGATASR